MLTALRERSAAAGLANLVCVRAGFLSYQHPGPPADGVYTRNALHQLPDFWKALALDRIARMLRPGGVLRLRDLIYDFAPGDAEGIFLDWFEQAAADPADGYTGEDYAEHIRTEFSTFRWLLEPCSTWPASRSSPWSSSASSTAPTRASRGPAATMKHRCRHKRRRGRGSPAPAPAQPAGCGRKFHDREQFWSICPKLFTIMNQSPGTRGSRGGRGWRCRHGDEEDAIDQLLGSEHGSLGGGSACADRRPVEVQLQFRFEVQARAWMV